MPVFKYIENLGKFEVVARSSSLWLPGRNIDYSLDKSTRAMTAYLKDPKSIEFWRIKKSISPLNSVQSAPVLGPNRWFVFATGGLLFVAPFLISCFPFLRKSSLSS